MLRVLTKTIKSLQTSQRRDFVRFVKSDEPIIIQISPQNSKIFNSDDDFEDENESLFNDPLYLFATKSVIFPYTALVTRFNEKLYKTLIRNNIKYVGAFTIKDETKVSTILPENDYEILPIKRQSGVNSKQKPSLNREIVAEHQGLKKYFENLKANYYQHLIFDQNVNQKYNQEVTRAQPPILSPFSIGALHPLGTLCKLDFQTFNNGHETEIYALLKGIQRIELVEKKSSQDFIDARERVEKQEEEEAKKKKFNFENRKKIFYERQINQKYNKYKEKLEKTLQEDSQKTDEVTPPTPEQLLAESEILSSKPDLSKDKSSNQSKQASPTDDILSKPSENSTLNIETTDENVIQSDKPETLNEKEAANELPQTSSKFEEVSEPISYGQESLKSKLDSLNARTDAKLRKAQEQIDGETDKVEVSTEVQQIEPETFYDAAFHEQFIYFAKVSPIKEPLTMDQIMQDKVQEIIKLYYNIKKNNSINTPELYFSFQDPKVVDILCGFLSLTAFLSRIQVLELFQTIALQKRIERCYEFYQRFDQTFSQILNQVKKDNTLPLDPQSNKKQLEKIYQTLKKQMISPRTQAMLQKIFQQIQQRQFPAEIKKLIDQQIEELTDLPENHPEFNTKKQYLEFLLSIPFGKLTEDNFNLENVKRVLNEDHFGIDEVKERILEFIAVSKLRNKVSGKTILLVGPPGTGKTSIASSIAKCLGRKFQRISLGGEYDVAIIKGHRKTYLGSYPGKILQALKLAETENPVILLDEVDKITRSFRGNLQDALLEVLDPVQNNRFIDNYAEIPIDLSKVLFICSANLLETLHPALLDRTEVIKLSGYTQQEKFQILQKHLMPKNIKLTGLDKFQAAFSFQEASLFKLINEYAREAGLRNLERHLKRILEKIAFKLVKQVILPENTYEVTPENLKSLIGLPVFGERKMYTGIPPAGIIYGLAYNSYGGSVLTIETMKCNTTTQHEDVQAKDYVIIGEQKQAQETRLLQNRRGMLKLTGSLGSVMQESVAIAYTLTKRILSTFFNNKYLEINDVHIHFPEGASPKDGPSAGVAIASSLVSLALNQQCAGEIAMTGEVSLTGKVLKIGGVKDKILAAKREGIKKVILPISNKSDVDSLQDYIKEDMEFVFAEQIQDVLKALFPGLPLLQQQ